MKRLMLGIALCVALMFGVAGCEGLTPTGIQTLAVEQQQLQDEVDALQAAAAEMAADLASGGIVGADAKLAKINEETDRVQAQIALIAQALKDVPLTGDVAQDVVAQLQAANAASGGFNPYVVPMGGVLSLLSIALAWVAKRKTTEAAAAQAKYQAHKRGVEKTMKEISTNEDSGVKAIGPQLYNNIGAARADIGV